MQKKDRTVRLSSETIPQLGSIKQFKNLHYGKDIYILCSGSSLDLVDHSFFEGKVTIGVNGVAMTRKVDYTICKEYTSPFMERMMFKNSSFVLASLYKYGNKEQGFVELNKNCFRSPQAIYYDHHENQRGKPDLSIFDMPDNKLVVSWSTVTTAIHLAYWMGAKNIILVGHDCGKLNGKIHIDGYQERNDGSVSAWSNKEQSYVNWLSKIEAQTALLRDYLKKEYNINIYSINPYVSLALEGAIFSQE